jgi:hypothetical protein
MYFLPLLRLKSDRPLNILYEPGEILLFPGLSYLVEGPIDWNEI